MTQPIDIHEVVSMLSNALWDNFQSKCLFFKAKQTRDPYDLRFYSVTNFKAKMIVKLSRFSA